MICESLTEGVLSLLAENNIKVDSHKAVFEDNFYEFKASIGFEEIYFRVNRNFRHRGDVTISSPYRYLHRLLKIIEVNSIFKNLAMLTTKQYLVERNLRLEAFKLNYFNNGDKTIHIRFYDLDSENDFDEEIDITFVGDTITMTCYNDYQEVIMALISKLIREDLI